METIHAFAQFLPQIIGSDGVMLTGLLALMITLIALWERL